MTHSKTHNPFIPLAALAVAGFAMQASRKGPKARLMRMAGRPIEFKDKDGELTALLGEIKSGVKNLTDRVAALETKAPEVKSADVDSRIKQFSDGLKADLQALRDSIKDTPELKSLDGKLLKLSEQLSETERKINQAVIESGPRSKKKRDQKSLDAITAKMKAQEPIEVKALDSDLKQQDIFNEETPRKGLGILAFVRQRPTAADAPRCSYVKGGTVRIKGESSAATTGATRVKRIGSVKTLEHEGLITQEDVDDAGALMLDDELTSATDAIVQELRGQVIDDCIEANLVDPDSSAFGEDDDFALLTTASAGTWTATDIINLVNQVPEEYREGSIFIANSTMVPTLCGIEDTNGNALFLQSLTSPIPQTLAGYRFIEESHVANDRLIFGNPNYGLMVWERVKPELSNINRTGGDYVPYYRARYAWSKRDTRAMAAMDLTPGS